MTATPALRGTSIGDALHSAVTAIAASGSATPRLDAELLLAHVLGVSRERLVLDRDARVPTPAVRPFQDAVRRRSAQHEPVAYIVGRRAFRHIELAVDPRVLIPRPETELLVEVGLTLARGARVLDVGTGSGAVALALKHERPDLDVAASDASAPALEVARANGRRLGLDVRWLTADLLQGIDEPIEAILSNPPYIAESERSLLPADVIGHEPEAALFAGDDGLAVIDALLAQAATRAVALVAVEVGAGQAERVIARARELGFGSVRRVRDLAGIERAVVAERPLRSRSGGFPC